MQTFDTFHWRALAGLARHNLSFTGWPISTVTREQGKPITFTACLGGLIGVLDFMGDAPITARL